MHAYVYHDDIYLYTTIIHSWLKRIWQIDSFNERLNEKIASNKIPQIVLALPSCMFERTKLPFKGCK